MDYPKVDHGPFPTPDFCPRCGEFSIPWEGICCTCYRIEIEQHDRQLGREIACEATGVDQAQDPETPETCGQATDSAPAAPSGWTTKEQP